MIAAENLLKDYWKDRLREYIGHKAIGVVYIRNMKVAIAYPRCCRRDTTPIFTSISARLCIHCIFNLMARKIPETYLAFKFIYQLSLAF